jgi:UDP-N-acetyl-D-mannosaminuronic acid transferase (WecB/TagA/CpsF family)
MQRAGLEFLFRLMVEPKRLWRRYLLLCPRVLPPAIYAAVRERIALRTRAVKNGA